MTLYLRSAAQIAASLAGVALGTAARVVGRWLP